MSDVHCTMKDCAELAGRRGPYCNKHGCILCGATVLPELAKMREPMCSSCYEGAKKAPAMKKHPKENLLFHVSIEVDADKLSDAKLKREVLPGLVRSDGKPMDVKEFRRMCREARARGWLVLPPCTNINQSGQCLGHEAPKVDLSVIADTSLRVSSTADREIERIAAELQPQKHSKVDPNIPTNQR